MKHKSNNKIILRLEILLIMSFLITVSLTPLTMAENKTNSSTFEKDLIIERIDKSGLDFSIYVDGFSTQTVEENEMTFEKLSMSNCGHTSDYGKAELPTLSYYVAVPQDADIVVNFEVSDESMISLDYDLYPSQSPKPETQGYVDPPFMMTESFYSSDKYYPYSVVETNPIVNMRGCRIAMVNVFPFSYNPADKTVKIAKEIDIDIDFIGGTGEFIPERLRSPYFQPIFDAFILNSQSMERAVVNNPDYNLNQLSKADRADFLIVVYDDFYDEILPLAEWRHKTGLETKVVKWSEIGTTAAELRAYMNVAYDTWELPPSFLLIVGDADHIPVNYLYTHPYDGDLTGTDHWYVALDDIDYLPELHEGRISVENAAELTIVVNKILEYSKNPYMGGDWFNNVLLASYEESGRYFVWGSETIYDYLDPLGYNVIRQYEGGSPPGSTSGVIDAINNGVIIANHRDHGGSQNSGGSYTGWSHPRFTTTNIIDDLNNVNMYPIMFSLNCESGWFDGETDANSGNYESIGEVGIRAEDKGFSAVVAHTRVSWSGYNDEIGRGHYDAMFPDFDPDYPDDESANPYDTAVFRISQIMNYGKYWVYDKYIVPGGCPPYPWSPDYEASRTTFEMLHVNGDPTMEVWTEMPKALIAVHPDTIPGGQSIFEVSVSADGEGPIEGALVCLSQEEGIYIKGFTDESGEVELEIDEVVSEEEATLVVTKYNHLYYSSQVTVHVNTPPNIPDSPSGPDVGSPGTFYLFTASTTDIDNDRIYYCFSWGDDTYSEWVGPFDSDSPATAQKSWDESGTYEIKVKAKDTCGEETDWSDPMEVRMPRLFSIRDRIEMNFPLIHSILSKLFGI